MFFVANTTFVDKYQTKNLGQEAVQSSKNISVKIVIL